MLNIMRFIHGGGFVMYPLLLLALAAVAVIVERLMAFRQFGAVPPGLLAETLAQARRREPVATAETLYKASPILRRTLLLVLLACSLTGTPGRIEFAD